MIELSKKSDHEILELVNPIMDNLMDGSIEVNHEKHVRDFTDRLKKIVTKEALSRMCGEYQAKWGHFRRRFPVAIFRRENSVAVVWKQECSISKDEFVAEAVFVESAGKILVDHALVY
jgi:hypothetical protein